MKIYFGLFLNRCKTVFYTVKNSKWIIVFNYCLTTQVDLNCIEFISTFANNEDLYYI